MIGRDLKRHLAGLIEEIPDNAEIQGPIIFNNNYINIHNCYLVPKNMNYRDCTALFYHIGEDE